MKAEDLNKLRHSVAHLLAHAVTELFPKTKLTIGPATQTGFFYDFLPEVNLKEDDLPAISQRMTEIAERNLPITHREIPKDEARALYKDNPFKLELIDQIPGDTVGLAEQGDFYDLCRGGHLESTGKLKHFKLLGISGSYWRADRNNQPLQRIAGTAFPNPKELRLFEKRREEALKYDHRKLGKELDLFSFNDVGAGFPFFHPNGTKVLQLMRDFLRKKIEDIGFREIQTPTMLNDELWKRSGHYDHYKDNMYFCEIEEKSFAIKPMNCPGAILVYDERPRSYRELPMRLGEFGLVHRYELSGVLHGLFRVRAFTIDDGHIFCTKEQVQDEIIKNIQLTKEVLHAFGFENITVGVSTKPDNAMGSDDVWKIATDALIHGLKAAELPCEIYEGEGAFYGPKIEFRIEDSMGRTWQCGTVQVDFFQAENFDLSYVSSKGTKERPVIIHRAIYGSFERFFGIVLEHYKGKLPFWLAPLQVKVMTITDDQMAYATGIRDTLHNAGIRAQIDTSTDPISGKIKTAQLARIPWMLIIGQKEVDQKTVTLRYLSGKQEFGLSLDQLLEKAQSEQK